MPTASGRETAQEKRDRQNREHWARVDAAIAALNAERPGWADAEAAQAEAREAELRASGAPSYQSHQPEYATATEAQAVARALKARGWSRTGTITSFSLASNDPERYIVRFSA